MSGSEAEGPEYKYNVIDTKCNYTQEYRLKTPRFMYVPNSPVNKRRDAFLPMTRVVNSSIYSMRIMTTKAETVTLLVALICSNTKLKKAKQK